MFINQRNAKWPIVAERLRVDVLRPAADAARVLTGLLLVVGLPAAAAVLLYKL